MLGRGSGYGHRTRRDILAPAARLTIDDVQRHLRECCLTPSSGRRVGVEVESLVGPGPDGVGRVPFDALQKVVDGIGPLPAGSRITYEPGGQLEISSPPSQGPAAACAATAVDLELLRGALGAEGFRLGSCGLHPVLAPQRELHSPRYDAMEIYFDCRVGERPPADGFLANPGRTMMCSSAAVQVNVDFGPDVATTWHLAHDLGPVLVAAFANSPLALGAPTGWRSARVANWWALDPPRTYPIEPRPPAGRPVNGTGPAAVAAQLTTYVLDAPVMLLREADDQCTPMRSAVPFGQWLSAGIDGRYPNAEDLHYHLTTLFPPVRPRRWLELRMIDSLAEPWWRVPVAVAATLLHDPAVAAGAYEVLAPARGLWLEGARHGLEHPILGAAAVHCFSLVADALEASQTEKSLAPVVRAYFERYVQRGRCPADDMLDTWHRTGSPLPEEPAVP